jgi:hypothetical protein
MALRLSVYVYTDGGPAYVHNPEWDLTPFQRFQLRKKQVNKCLLSSFNITLLASTIYFLRMYTAKILNKKLEKIFPERKLSQFLH